LPQESTGKAIHMVQRHAQALPFTPWHRLEVRNAIRLAQCHDFIDSREARTQLKQLDADLADEVLLKHQVIDWTDVLRQAERLGAAHNHRIGCRSADLFHVSSAVETGCRVFLTFDEKQAALARAAGLRVEP
jgi:predicted nucleic acid-binding protein